MEKFGIREVEQQYEAVAYMEYTLPDGEGIVHRAITTTYSEFPTTLELALKDIAYLVSNPAPWCDTAQINFIPFQSNDIHLGGNVIYRAGLEETQTINIVC